MSSRRRFEIAAGVTFLVALTAADRPPVHAAASYTLSGSPDGTSPFHVDDDLDVYLNGVLISSDNTPPGTPTTRPPIALTADVGDTLRFVVRDTYGVCAQLTTLFLTDAAGRSTVADPGFHVGCGRPNVDLGVVHDYSFVIPDLGATPVAAFVADIRLGTASSNPRDLVVFQNALYFSATDGVSGRELWRLGTSGPPQQVADINPGAASSSPQQLTVVADTLYFVATTPAEGAELWRYDGSAPPALVADLTPGPSGSDLEFLTAFGALLVFEGSDGVIGEELFSFDGTTLTPYNLFPDDPSCAPFCDSDPESLTVHNGLLYFTALHPTAGVELWTFDGTTPTLLADLGPGSTGPQGITGLGNMLIFGAFDFGQYRLFSYDLTTRVGGKISDVIVNDVRVRPATRFAPFDGRVYLPANDGLQGEELWSTDGVTAQPAADVNPGAGDSLPRWLTPFNGELYFGAADALSGDELRAFNGASHRLVADLNPGAIGSSFNKPASFGPFLIFEARAADGQLHPWFSTGTAPGTQVVRKSDGTLINPTGGSIDVPTFVAFNGALYFAATDGSTGPGHGTELWRLTLGASAPTTTTLTSSLNPSTVGDQVTFTATVTGTNPTGTVTFFDSGTPLGSVALVNGTATFPISSLGAGSHTLTATYSGDAANAPSTSSDLIQVVNKIQTTTALIASPNPSVYTESVTLTATVSGGAPSGTVTFFDGATGLATVALVGNTATLQIATLTGGAHTLTASYAGDATHTASVSNAVQHTVTPLPTTTSLSSSPDPSRVGEAVTFSAFVTGAGPTGDVVFSEGGTTLATVALVNNLATFQTSTLSAGVHTITAAYVGDGNHAGSAAGDNHTVNDPSPPTAPVAHDQTVSLFEDGQANILLTASDVNNDPLTFVIVGQPTNGSLTGAPPNVRYTPNPNYAGQDSFTFRANDGTFDSNLAIVTITITAVNDPPVAGDDSYATPEDTPLVVPAPGVLGNDTDIEGTALTAVLVTGPVNGTLSLSPVTGAFTYTPAGNYFGPDSFTYRASDNVLTSTLATVSITVTPVNDPPVAIGDAYTTPANTPLIVAAPGVLGNDSDLDGPTISAVLGISTTSGALTLNANGAFTYTPTTGFTGTDSFTYQAFDGMASSAAVTVTISVTPSTFKWTMTGALGDRRRNHTATRLPNGKVLVAGGFGHNNRPTASAELYDPVAGTWTATGNMTGRRALHTATLLSNGHVLVAGGENGNALLTSTETYDPATGIWTPAGNMGIFHTSHTATLLSNGKVLVAGGFGGVVSLGALGVAELYDATTRTWSSTGSLNAGRYFHTATVLSNGRVLVAGGLGSSGPTTSAEIYDPVFGTWHMTGSLATARDAHTAILLLDGRVLVTGGDNTGPIASAELFDPATGTWTPAGSLATGRFFHSATRLQSGLVLVAGGIGLADAVSTSELYNPASGSWTPTASLNAARGAHTATLLFNGKVLAAGGYSNAGTGITAELFESASGPASGTWTDAPSVLNRRADHTATRLADGRVIVAGGGNRFLGTYLTSSEIFDPRTGSWTTTGSMVFPRALHTAVLLGNGRILVAGGVNRTGAMNSAELYDPGTGIWSRTGSLGTPRFAATATLLPDGRVLVAGGVSNAPLSSAEIYDPATGLWTPTGSFIGNRAHHTATALANGQVLVAGGFGSQGNFYLSSGTTYDPLNGAWTNTLDLGTRRHSHTATLLQNGQVLIAGGFGSSGELDRAELFNPVSRNWTSTARMVGGRGGHQATLLNDGTVLVSGGLGSRGDIASTETYSLASGAWTARGNLSRPRASHTATLLLNGTVLVVGGFSNGVLLSTAEIYTP